MPPRARAGGAGIRSYSRSHSRSCIRSCIGRPGKGRSRAEWRPDRTAGAGRCVRTPRSPPGAARGASVVPGGGAGPGRRRQSNRTEGGPGGGSPPIRPDGAPEASGVRRALTNHHGPAGSDPCRPDRHPPPPLHLPASRGKEWTEGVVAFSALPKAAAELRKRAAAAGSDGVRTVVPAVVPSVPPTVAPAVVPTWNQRGTGVTAVGRPVDADGFAGRAQEPPARRRREPRTEPTYLHQDKDRRRVVGTSGPPKTAPDMR
ncbi:hypothetical protein KAURM247S_04476 [Kitasatospora aureofaciens]